MSSETQQTPVFVAHNVCFVIVVLGYWGKGKTLREAAANCVKEGASRSEKCVAYCYTHPDAKVLEGVRVDGMGDISYPTEAQSIYLFGLKEGQRVTLGSLMGFRKPEQVKEGA